MNDQKPENSQATQDDAGLNTGTFRAMLKSPHQPAVGNIISKMSITQLTLALLVVVFLWQWFDAHSQINQVQQEVAKRLSEMDGSNKANQTLVTQNQEVVRELGGKLSVLESKFAESQNQRAALDALYQEMSSSRDQTALAEVEQMLMIAAQQLQLSANIKAALIAMQHADDRLKRLDRPTLTNLRKTINQDIDKLRTLPLIDITGINMRIDGLVVAIDTLPLSQNIRPEVRDALAIPVPDEGVWKKFWRELWQEAKHLVRIENTQKRELPLLSPTQSFFLKENLKIRLLSARLALLSHDEASYKHDLKTAQEWTKLYFDTQSKEGALVLASLQKLAASNINIELPDIGGSLEAVRNYRISHEKVAR
ncbi:MAG: uroporphyrinogen-III C-methyltransferase [Gallionellaceae bacterium]